MLACDRDRHHPLYRKLLQRRSNDSATRADARSTHQSTAPLLNGAAFQTSATAVSSIALGMGFGPLRPLFEVACRGFGVRDLPHGIAVRPQARRPLADVDIVRRGMTHAGSACACSMRMLCEPLPRKPIKSPQSIGSPNKSKGNRQRGQICAWYDFGYVILRELEQAFCISQVRAPS